MINETTDSSQQSGRGRFSPDGRWKLEFEGHNVALRELRSGQVERLTIDGVQDDGYRPQVWWSPNSKHFVVQRVRKGQRREVSMIESSPNGSIHSQVVTHQYAKPGDELDRTRLVMFHVDDPKPIVIDDELFGNPYRISRVKWHDNGRSFSFLYNQRGHQVMRVIKVDAETATPSVLIDETSETFVCYSQKSYLHRIDSTDEVIWMSVRSGWNHLYLIDQSSGEVKNPITSGEWVVRGVEKLDDQKRLAWLRVSGMDPREDPYHVHLIRVDFEGMNLVRLTRGDGDHRWEFSPDGRYLIDTHSRVDRPARIVLRDADSGRRVCKLEQTDISALRETDWRPPERFVAKGRDGETDIYGMIVRPTNFDPNKKYPVLESIYAGPTVLSSRNRLVAMSVCMKWRNSDSSSSRSTAWAPITAARHFTMFAGKTWLTADSLTASDG